MHGAARWAASVTIRLAAELLLHGGQQRRDLHLGCLEVGDQGRGERGRRVRRLRLAGGNQAEAVRQVALGEASRPSVAGHRASARHRSPRIDGPAPPRASTSSSDFANTPCVSTSAGRVMLAEIGSRNGRSLNAVA